MLFVLVVIDRNITWDRIYSLHTSEPMNRKWEEKLKQIEERASHYERKPLSSVYRPRLSKPEEPPSIWRLFHRQAQAFNFVKSCKEVISSSSSLSSSSTSSSCFFFFFFIISVFVFFLIYYLSSFQAMYSTKRI